eukprot:TRINITY_DN6419_c0_g1_i3.p1 TRINITY_DN6419_c0_g1~~TRINITY_DN6419_c0_g1_i3.p1  ORF type:complete len:158 (-),score=41.32 TRINITY_DN6419_c0_g1_i3:64-513(-)
MGMGMGMGMGMPMGMGMGMGMSPMGMGFPGGPHAQQHQQGSQAHPPPPAEDEPEGKKQKTASVELISEEEFLKKVSDPVTIKVLVPAGKPEWKWEGQTLSISISPRETVKHLQDKIQELLGMPSSKQKLKTDALPFLERNFFFGFLQFG